MKQIICFVIFVVLVSTLSIPLFAQWVETSKPSNNTVSAFASYGPGLFVSTQGSGIFLTTNNGDSWNPVNNGLASLNVYSLAASGTKLYAGTWNKAIFSSTDNGANWNPVITGRRDSSINSLLAFDSYVFAGTYPYNNILRSTDNGVTWDGSYLGNYQQTVYTIILSGTNLFAGTCYAGAYRSTNYGSGWQKINTGLPVHHGGPQNPNDLIIDVFALGACGTYLYAGLQSGVFVSTNNGDYWTSASSGITGYYFYSFAVYLNNVFVGGGDDGVYATSDNGASWRSIGTGLTDNSVVRLFVSGTNLFAGTNSGSVFRRALSDMIPPSVPMLVLPFFNAMNVPCHFNFICGKASLATKYHWQISRSSTFTSCLINDTTSDTTRYVSSLAKGTKYFWRVRAINPAGTSAFSTKRSFWTIGVVPEAPVLISPVQVIGVPRKTTFKWHSSKGATRYHLQVATGNLPFPNTIRPTPRIVVDTILADTTKHLWRPLDKNKTYIWCVRAANAHGESPVLKDSTIYDRI